MDDLDEAIRYLQTAKVAIKPSNGYYYVMTTRERMDDLFWMFTACDILDYALDLMTAKDVIRGINQWVNKQIRIDTWYDWAQPEWVEARLAGYVGRGKE